MELVEDIELYWDTEIYPRTIPVKKRDIQTRVKVGITGQDVIIGIVLLVLVLSNLTYPLVNKKASITEKTPSISLGSHSIESTIKSNVPSYIIPVSYPREKTPTYVKIKSVDEINYWASVIETYIKDSPLEGYGIYFARAAWEYGIDPRLSVAISQMESNKGVKTPEGCEFNIWGVTRPSGGFKDYPDMITAINEHTSLIKRVYGEDSTPESMSKKYCPPNWNKWQNVVRDNMEKVRTTSL